MKVPKLNSDLKRQLLARYNSFPVRELGNLRLKKREVFLNNHKNYIIGYVDNDFSSIDVMLNEFTLKSPKGVILGNSNKNVVNRYSNLEKYYKLPVKIYSNKDPENLLAKQEYKRFFEITIDSNPVYFKNPDDELIFELDKRSHCKRCNMNLTVSFVAVSDESSPTRIFHGKADELILLEDLCHNYSLNDLQYMLKSTMNTFNNIQEENSYNNYPLINFRDFDDLFLEVSKYCNTDSLFDNQIKYTCSVFNKVNLFYNKNNLIIDDAFVDLAFKYSNDSLLSPPEKFFDFSFYSANQESGELENKLISELELILEKIVILRYLFSKELDNFMLFNNNPFKNKQFFGGKFSSIPDIKVFTLYKQIKKVYEDEYKSLHYYEVKRINNLGGLENKRRYGITHYEKELEYVESNSFKYLTNYRNRLRYLDYANKLLLLKICLNFTEKQQNGYNINEQLTHIQNYLGGLVNKQNTQVFKSLVAEANAELRLLNLPMKDYYQFDAYMNNVIEEKSLNNHSTNIKKLEEAQMNIHNQAKNIKQVIIKTGGESPMELDDTMRLIDFYSPKNEFINSSKPSTNNYSLKISKTELDFNNKLKSNISQLMNLPIELLKRDLDKKIKNLVVSIKRESKFVDVNQSVILKNFDVNTIDKNENDSNKMQFVGNIFENLSVNEKTKKEVLKRIKDNIPLELINKKTLTAVRKELNDYIIQVEQLQKYNKIEVQSYSGKNFENQIEKLKGSGFGNPTLDKEVIKRLAAYGVDSSNPLQDKKIQDLLNKNSIEELKSLGLDVASIPVRTNKYGSLVAKRNDSYIDSSSRKSIHYELTRMEEEELRKLHKDDLTKSELTEKEKEEVHRKYVVQRYNQYRTNTNLSPASIEGSELQSFRDQVAYLSIDMQVQQEERFEKIENALNSGRALDDPLYYEELCCNKDYIIKREEYLRRYYRNQEDENYSEKAAEKVMEEIEEGVRIKNDQEYRQVKLYKASTEKEKLFNNVLRKYIYYDNFEKEEDKRKKKFDKYGEEYSRPKRVTNDLLEISKNSIINDRCEIDLNDLIEDKEDFDQEVVDKQNSSNEIKEIEKEIDKHKYDNKNKIEIENIDTYLPGSKKKKSKKWKDLYSH